jgi:hypothetical protein
MRAILVILLLATAQMSPPLASDAFKRLAVRLPLDLVGAAAPTDLAGRYTGQTAELRARVGPFLTGEDLYLFSDGSYVYCEWGDIMPKTVHDKGQWSATGGLLELRSDADIRWAPGIGRRHVMVRRPQHNDEIMLVGLPEDVEYFEQKAADDPELMLLIVGMARTDVFSNGTSGAVKSRLMKEAWNPAIFRKPLPPNPRLQPPAAGAIVSRRG